MKRAQPILALLLVLAPAAPAMANQLGASSGASAAQEPASAAAPAPPMPPPSAIPPAPPRKAPLAAKSAPAQKAGATAPNGPITGSVVDRPSLPLANVSMLHVEVLPIQGDAEKCGLEANALQTAAVYPLAASARLKVGQGTLTHMHVRLSAVYVRRIEHCIVNADIRVSSLQQVELQHSKAAVAVYVPLWEKTDIRLVPRALAQKLALERLRQISETLLIAWAAQN